MRKIIPLLLLLCIAGLPALSQTATINGYITDSSSSEPLEGAYVLFEGLKEGSVSNRKGYYSIEIPAGQEIAIYYKFVFQQIKKQVGPFEAGSVHRIDIRFTGLTTGTINVREERNRDIPSVITLDAQQAKKLPNPSGNFEALLKLLGPVTSNNELSSSYNVRGGNYDENLIYVNDIEIYRPQLIRSGQQEGLSFINPDMAKNVKFSAGGFEAKYGDKLSSVLDVTYRQTDSFEAGGNVGMLGGQLFVGGKKTSRFHYMVGARYRSNQYLLGSLDVQGDYKPRFADIQAYVSYKINSRWELSYLGSFAHNRYLFIPESQTTSFGTVQQALQLSVYFNGAELMEYNTFMNGLTLKHEVNKNLTLRFIASGFYSKEKEFYTTEGAYRLDELDKDLGSEDFGKAKFNRGYGYFINHARNELESYVYNAAFKGDWYKGKNHKVEFGVQFQHEIIDDILNEWVYNDSAEYSVPYNYGDSLFLNSRIYGVNSLNSQRYSAYIQDRWILDQASNMMVIAGLRTNYWSLNKQNVLSPRLQFSFEPNRKHNRDTANTKNQKKDIVLKAAFGYYYQPPFYRELRSLEGKVNPNVKAQRSIHYVLGGDWNFKLWDRPFKLFAEAYYKQLSYLVPYQLENVRIRYHANNDSRGYATGIDTRINGEFVKGLESWFSISVMQTKEKITYENEAGERVETDWLKRPTDQRINMTVFFQDELPKWPEYKVHLSFIYGSRLPYYLGGPNRYEEGFQVPAYRRVDIGFSREIVGEEGFKNIKLNKYFDRLWISLEVFNLFQIRNTVSYLWVRDINSDTYAVPNYLTSRRINLNILFTF